MLTSANNTPIYADVTGDPTKPALVFIHGFGLCASAFDGIFDDTKWSESLYLVGTGLIPFRYCSIVCTQVRYDTRRHGRSRMPTEASVWELRRLVEDFDAVVDVFGLTRPFVLAWYMSVFLALRLPRPYYIVFRSLGGTPLY